ncbi:MAG TPA: serine hydrolase [Blastocatellia bacterium]|nr:serine hydrolase [Blastocatellia bacterium]
MRYSIISLALLAISVTAYVQTDLVKNEGIKSPLHQRNVGRVTFMSKLIPIDEYKETDFLKSFELKESSDLNIRVFMGNSLTNYLHTLAPALSAEELTRSGNYQFSFFVDGALVYKENLHPGAGLAESKNTRTVFRVPLISTTNEDSWGRFLWNRFMISGGEEALSAGTHLLKLEIRPYLKATEIKVGDLIAQGQLQVVVVKPSVDEKQIAIQPIKPASGWEISNDDYDKAKFRDLNLRIAQNTFKEITSVVVIKEGKLLIEEYFNGAGRETLHDTRSVGKSFASALAGLAIRDGHIKSEDQTLREFYDLNRFANNSPKKAGVTIKSLLSMSSAFDGSDMNEDSPGNEEKMYPTGDWVKFTLDLPIDSAKVVGENWDYFTAGVVLLGDILNKSVPGGLEKYADQKLFKPLGIKKYEWQYTPQKVVSTAGGLRMSSLDLAKFGQLYKNGGLWKGEPVIPRSWVESSLTKRLKLPDEGGGFYGYLFWNGTYNVNGKQYEAFYASGNGGNKIFIFKDEPLVVVITATAYNRPYAHPQVNRMMERYILPAVINPRRAF